ncbi:MAG TPA: M1 family aminopeptidase [Bacteroidales bacterium]|nr:M1 family aminopeptidase [Bacteroidales bacterium]
MKKLPSPLTPVSIIIAALVITVSCRPIDENKYFEEGVSKFLATYRAATVSEVSYKLAFAIPDTKDQTIPASAVIEFRLSSKREPLVLDFRVPESYLESVSANGKELTTAIKNEHIIIPERYLRRRLNTIKLKFRAGDMSLNRNDDYLYTLFVPDRASTAFPCFDQPDIKARFSLTLEMPADYEAMSDSPVHSTDTVAGRKTVRFEETRPISTYLFAFAAGRFERIEKEIDGIKMEMLHRETRPEFIANNAEEIFRLHYNSLKWLEKYTLIPYPFDKFGFVLIPSFQYSGMEHPGSIFYRASGLLLESAPTLNEQLARASLIAHETSHIWFGDLVTMQWFDDVWLKEVFAGFMADKIVSPDFPDVNHDLRFLLSRFPAAYAVDRTKGTNPIIQHLDNMKDAGSLYGGIIYNKAPIVMRHLEQITGEDGLEAGLRTYLKKYSYGNARWDDLIKILEKETSEPLEEWSISWVKEAGMPVIELLAEKTDTGYSIRFKETDPDERLRHWPQELSSMIITATDTVAGKCIPGDNNSFINVTGEPLCVIPDASGSAYGSFMLDTLTIRFLTKHINEFPDPLVRGTLWLSLNENLINRNLKTEDFYRTVLSALKYENDIQLRNYLIGRLTSAFWDYFSDGQRKLYGEAVEEFSYGMMQKEADPSQRRTWYNMFRSVALTEEGLARLGKIWVSGTLSGSQKLSEDDLSTLAFTLALKGHPDADRILKEQRARLTGTDRISKFDFIMPALSKDQTVRDAFFESLRHPSNREHEPWVLEALGYLHHPLMAEQSEKYILPSLEMLEEIKATGDIFFPGSWISTTLRGYHSSEAATTVEKFLEEHSAYPQDLELKILQAADQLLRDQI